MGNNLNQSTIIIDFFGLPGSGKTTISHILGKKLRQNGYIIQEDIYYINNRYNAVSRILIKIVYSLTYTIKNLLFMKNLFSVFSKGDFVDCREMIKQWINICFVLTVLDKNRNKDYIIADQGIAQAAISLVANSNQANIDVVFNKLYEKVKTPIVSVYVSIDINNDIERLQKRKNGRSRIDKEVIFEKRQLSLNIIKSNCEKLAHKNNCLVISNDVTVDNIEDNHFYDLAQEIESHLIKS